MLCTGKSGSNNWLDRLRSSKGFPDGDGLDLEHFLNPNPNSDFDVIMEKNDPKSNSDLVVFEEKTVAYRKKTVTNSKPQNTMEKEDLFDIMSCVLEELFNMGDSDRIREIRGFDKKKSSRKQSNPKICVSAASASVDDCCLNEQRRSEGVPAMSPSSADNSVTEEKKVGDRLKMKKQGNISGSLSVEVKKLKAAEFSGYSRADVMVIDTSAPVWKSEKILFRKGNVWKVRDKKSKCRRVFGTRKRKSSSQSDSEGAGKKKKKKKQKLSLSPISTIKEAGQGKCIMSTNERCRQNSTMGGTPHNVNQVPEKRHRFSRSARKPAKAGSSVFHVQDIPANRKNGVQLLKSCP